MVIVCLLIFGKTRRERDRDCPLRAFVENLSADACLFLSLARDRYIKRAWATQFMIRRGTRGAPGTYLSFFPPRRSVYLRFLVDLFLLDCEDRAFTRRANAFARFDSRFSLFPLAHFGLESQEDSG